MTVTEIADDRLRFRGYDGIALATSRSFEDVAALLWTGSFEDPAAAGPWQATGEAIAAGTAAQAALPPDTYPLERLQVIVPAVAATDRLRLHLDRPAVIAAASSLIAAMVDCQPAADPGPAVDQHQARPAQPEPAAEPRPGQAQVMAEHVEQRRIRLTGHGAFGAVHGQPELGLHEISSSRQAWPVPPLQASGHQDKRLSSALVKPLTCHLGMKLLC